MNGGPIRYFPAVAHSWSRESDVVVIGAGAAGLSAALEASGRGHRVTLICKAGLASGSTLHAQGGMAAVSSPGDSRRSHVEDTLIAAAGIADETAVRQLVDAAPATVRYLESLGARFDAGALGLEGGHSHHRIVHAGGDAIGAELHRVLLAAVRNSDVEILEYTVAIDALRSTRGEVVGVVAGRYGPSDTVRFEVGVIGARAVIVATGGFGQAFTTSTNPPDVTGDGLAFAARAGAELTNVEFVQFHPTVVYVPGHRGQSALITEAIRGAGATIVDASGDPVMRGRHERGDLAPRDVVAFSMFQRMHAGAEPLRNLWLDARSIGTSRLEREFPTTVSLCRQAGFDPAYDLVPIAPGAHYACGGIRADMDGATSVTGLYAIGEAASTGVHGANRLASNSLTEAVITGRRLARRLDELLAYSSGPFGDHDVIASLSGRGVDPSTRDALAAQMSADVGVVRDRDGLERALDRLATTPDAREPEITVALLEATNLHTVSHLVTWAASLREESRGAHRRRDFPAVSPLWEHPIPLRVVDDQIGAYGRATADA